MLALRQSSDEGLTPETSVGLDTTESGNLLKDFRTCKAPQTLELLLMSLQFVWTWCLQGMMGIWENLTVLDPEQVTTEFQET